MSLNYQKDPAAQVPTLATGLDGADSVVQFYQNGTNEIKNLLKNECSIIYECSYCRSLFRSIVNFVAHKRTICRSLQHSVRLELDFIKKNSEKEKSNTNLTTKARRNPNSLRRVNIASLLGKHIENFNIELEGVEDSIELQTLPKISRVTPSTTFKNGQQILEHVPNNLLTKKRIPEDRTVLVMPQENSTRYREMQLRTRRNVNDTKNVICRELCQQDITILQRIPSILLELAEFQELRCIHDNCTNVQPFVSISVLSHHLAICHQKQFAELLTQNEIYKCFICGNQFQTERNLQDHFNDIHADDRLAHINQRLSIIKTENNSRLTQSTSRRSVSKKRSSSPDEEKVRFRSISPSELSSRSSAASSAHGTETSDLGSSAADTSRRSSVSPNASTQQSKLITKRTTQSCLNQSLSSLKERNNSFLLTQEQKNSYEFKETKNNKKSIFKENKLELSRQKRARFLTTIEQENKQQIVQTLLTNVLDKKNKNNTTNNSLSLNLTDDNVILSKKPQKINQVIDNKSKCSQSVNEEGVRRLQRNRKPTKRFYNEEYVVDPTKYETRRLIGVTIDNQTENDLNKISKSVDQINKKFQSNTKLLNNKSFVTQNIDLLTKTKKPRKPRTKKKLHELTLTSTINNKKIKKNFEKNIIENSNDLKTKKEMFDQVLKKTNSNVRNVSLEDISILTSTKTNEILNLQKSSSEPPVNSLIEKKKDEENLQSDSIILISHNKTELNQSNNNFIKNYELESQTNLNSDFLLPSSKNQLPSIS